LFILLIFSHKIYSVLILIFLFFSVKVCVRETLIECSRVVEGDTAICDGGGGALGHPFAYIAVPHAYIAVPHTGSIQVK
jgi:hypothetical protein